LKGKIMRKRLMLALLVATPLLFTGCAAKKNPYAQCDKLEPTLEEVKKGGNFMPYVTAKELKQEECREKIRGWK
jgi:lipoprotein